MGGLYTLPYNLYNELPHALTLHLANPPHAILLPPTPSPPPFVVVILTWLSPVVGPPVALFVISAGLLAARHSRSLRDIFLQSAYETSGMVAVASEALGAIKTVRTHAGEALEVDRFDDWVTQARATGLKAGAAKAVQEGIIRGSVHVALLLLFAVGGWMVHRGDLPIRALFSGIGFVFSLVFSTQV